MPIIKFRIIKTNLEFENNFGEKTIFFTIKTF